MKIAVTMHKSVLRLLLIFCSAFQTLTAISQTSRIDELRSAILSNNDNNKRLDLLLKMCEQHYSFSSDTLFYYYSLAKNSEPKKLEQEFRIADYYSIYLTKTNDNEKAVANYDSLLANLPSTLPKTIYLEILSHKCGALIRNNENKNAIESCFELLKSAESEKDTLYILKAYTFLGWANMEIEKYTDATIWLTKGLNLTTNEQLLEKVPALFSNNASCYNNLTRYDSALYFVNKSLLFAKKYLVLGRHQMW